MPLIKKKGKLALMNGEVEGVSLKPVREIKVEVHFVVFSFVPIVENVFLFTA